MKNIFYTSNFLTASILLLFMCIVVEVLSRQMGFQSKTEFLSQFYNHKIKVTCVDSLDNKMPYTFLLPDKELGFQLNDGKYNISINNKINYQVTHKNGKRYTGKISNEKRNQILFIGCSYTYGMGVSDSLTFAYKFQKYFPDVELSNYSVPGDGTIQAYLRFMQISSEFRDSDILYFFIPDHLNRNIMALNTRISRYFSVKPYEKEFNNFLDLISLPISQIKYPFGEIEDDELQIKYLKYNELYKELPFTTESNFLFQVEKTLNYDRKKSLRNKEQVTIEAIRLIKERCQELNSNFYLVGLGDDNSVLNFLETANKKLDINIIHVDIDFNDPYFTFRPIDPHPNNVAHKFISEQLIVKWENHQR